MYEIFQVLELKLIFCLFPILVLDAQGIQKEEGRRMASASPIIQLQNVE